MLLTLVPCVLASLHLVAGRTARAQAADAAPQPQQARPAFEVNLLWPFFPGGISDFKFVLPTAQRGELLLGLHSDFAWRGARAKEAGKVATLAGKVGYRQFLIDGVHLDASVNLGWRQERDNPYDGTTLNAFTGRFWGFAGYQLELSEDWYANTRAGIGVHLWRTDKFGNKEREFVPAGDLNVGVRF